MKKLIFCVIFSFFFLVNSVVLFAMTYEVGFRVSRVVGGEDECAIIPVTVKKRIGGAVVKKVFTNQNPSSCCAGCDNFVLGLISREENLPEYGVKIDFGEDYIIVFEYEYLNEGLENLTVCYSRNTDGCLDEDGNFVTYDTFFDVTPDRCVRRPDTALCDETVIYNPDYCSIEPNDPDPVDPLSVSLVVSNEQYNGDKIIFTLRATATGGNESYSFSWSGATPISSSTTNPNYAKRTILSSQTRTVYVTVTSGSETVTKSITLSGEMW